MNTHHFTTACRCALQLLGVTPEQFWGEIGLTRLGITDFTEGKPLPTGIYRPAFKFFLRNCDTAFVALDLGKACLLDTLEDCGLDDGTIEEVQRALTSEAAVAHMFGQLPIPYLVAMSVIGNAAAKSPTVHNTLFGLAELCQAVARDQNVPAGFFSQHWKPSPAHRILLGGSLGALTAKIHGVSPQS